MKCFLALLFSGLFSTVVLCAPISKTLPEINTALGYGLDNSNSVARVDGLRDWSGSTDETGWTLGGVNTALATAETLTNTTARIDALEAAFVFDDLALCQFPAVLVSSGPAANRTLDLSNHVGNNVAVVFLRIYRDAVFVDDSWYLVHPFGSAVPADGVGYLYFAGSGVDCGSVACLTDSDGKVQLTALGQTFYVNLDVYLEAFAVVKSSP